MDDIWQRHKTFIVQCVIGGFIFLIALFVKSSMYGDEVPNLQAGNRALKKQLEEKPGPSQKSIEEQKARAEEARRQTEEIALQSASVKSGDEHARESIEWLLDTLGRKDQVDQFFTMYKETPQTCLSRLREEARGKLLGRAAELGKEIDETLGLNSGFEENEVRLGLHGLAMVADLVDRCLKLDGIDTVGPINISPRPRRPAGTTKQDGARAVVFSVRFGVTGEPAAVNELLRSFNRRDNFVKRITVLDGVEYIQRIRKEEDAVRASFYLFGIQYRGIEPGGTN